MSDLENKLGTLLNVGSEGVELGKSVVQDHLVGKSCDSDYKLVSYLIFSKGFKTFQTVQSLCRIGCGADGLSLCASLFENVVDLAYVARAPVRRPRRYIEYEQVGKLQQLTKVLRRKRLPKGLRKQFEAYRENIGPQAQSLSKYFPNASLGWSQKSLYQRAEAVKLDLEYCNNYWVFCGHKHTSPVGATGFVFEHEQGLDLIHGPSIKGVYHAAYHSTDYFLKLCLLFGQAHSLPVEDDIVRVAKRLGEAAHSTFVAHPEVCE
jgi:hypothetical protein